MLTCKQTCFENDPFFFVLLIGKLIALGLPDGVQ